jgi:hypothetical protein
MRDSGRLKPGDTVIVSFVGQTEYPHPHVFVEPGTDYDWRGLEGLHLVLAVRPGIDCTYAMKGAYRVNDVFQGYPTIVDVERKLLGCLVSDSPLKIWPIRKESEQWRRHFG